MNDRQVLVKVLLGALRRSELLHPHLDLPRITVFDDVRPKRARRGRQKVPTVKISPRQPRLL